MALGAKVVTVSDSSGTVIDKDGFTPAKLAELMDVKNQHYGRVDEYAERIRRAIPCRARRPGTCRWMWRCLAPRRTSSTASDARTLVDNGVICVAEGANMPSTMEAIKVFEERGVLFAPGKASNAGGVATSGLEMSQNAMRLTWAREEVDARLLTIMRSIHESCVQLRPSRGRQHQLCRRRQRRRLRQGRRRDAGPGRDLIQEAPRSPRQTPRSEASRSHVS